MEHPANVRTVYFVGAGMGQPDGLTGQALQALRDSDLILGAKRLLSLAEVLGLSVPCVPAYQAAEIRRVLQEYPQAQTISVLFSGDIGFYSGAAAAATDLADLPGISIQFRCGVSSLAYFCAKLQTAWQDVFPLSLHGREGNLLAAVGRHRKTFVLTDRERTPGVLCRELCDAGLPDIPVSIGERLSYPEERICRGTARQWAGETFHPLSVMLVENPRAAQDLAVHGIPDGEWIRGKTPMTKEEVRSVSLSKLRLRETDIFYDVGAGTGSVSVEAALRLSRGTVYALERDAEAISLLHANKEKWAVPNLHIIPGHAPDTFASLPSPDRAFLGGTGGHTRAVLAALREKNPSVRVVANVITLESLTETLQAFQELNFREVDIVQLQVSKAKKAGPYHMMLGQNPIYILSADGPGKKEAP